MKFEVGQKVRIKNEISLDRNRFTASGLFVPVEMERFFGVQCVVYSHGDDFYELSIDGSYEGCFLSKVLNRAWEWDDECLEPAGVKFK